MNDFTKTEKVAFDTVLENFQDALMISMAVSRYNIGKVDAERSSETVWRPQPYILPSYRGIDQTARLANKSQTVQRSVPSSLSTVIGVDFTLDAFEGRDHVQEQLLDTASTDRIASDINTEVLNVASNLGSIVVPRTNSAAGFSDVEAAGVSMTEVGIPYANRHYFASPRDNSGMAENLAARQTLNNIPIKAYRESYVGDVAKFRYMTMDHANILTAAAGGAVTINGANQRHVPAALQTTNAGEINLDNRFQTLALSSNANVKAGDCFSIAGVNSKHHITKLDTGQRKTFRIVSVGAGNTVVITPAIVATDGGPVSRGEEQYENVTATPADGAAIIWLNTADAHVNPFFAKNAIELLPGELQVKKGAGLAVMSGTTDNGVTLVMTRQGAIGDLSCQYRCDAYIGVVANNPEMMGIELFNQV